jgi:hypothetical protein
MIGACKDHPDKQKALFIMTYTVLMEELEKRKGRNEFDQMNYILKEIFKMSKYFYWMKEKNVEMFNM